MSEKSNRVKEEAKAEFDKTLQSEKIKKKKLSRSELMDHSNKARFHHIR